VEETIAKRVELRRHQRTVVPEGVAIRVSRGDGGPPVEGVATVIGLGGMFCRTKNTLAVGTELMLTLTCPIVSFNSRARIRHVNDRGMGIEFTELSPEDKQNLEQLLLDLHH
jgi:PilZ domain-containing protein